VNLTSPVNLAKMAERSEAKSAKRSGATTISNIFFDAKLLFACLDNSINS